MQQVILEFSGRTVLYFKQIDFWDYLDRKR